MQALFTSYECKVYSYVYIFHLFFILLQGCGGVAHAKKKRGIERAYKFSILQKEGHLGPSSSKVFIIAEGSNQCLDEK